MVIKEMIISFSEDEHRALLEIFKFYIQSMSNYKNSEVRVNSCGTSAEYRLMKSYLESSMGFTGMRDFFEKSELSRKEHIEWLFGSDRDDGEIEFNMPKSLEEMKEFLIKYDMDWLGD
jgi:hypothetical protein